MKTKNTAQSKPAQCEKHSPPNTKNERNKYSKGTLANKSEIPYNIPCGCGWMPLYRWVFTCAGLQVLRALVGRRIFVFRVDYNTEFLAMQANFTRTF